MRPRPNGALTVGLTAPVTAIRKLHKSLGGTKAAPNCGLTDGLTVWRKLSFQHVDRVLKNLASQAPLSARYPPSIRPSPHSIRPVSAPCPCGRLILEKS